MKIYYTILFFAFLISGCPGAGDTIKYDCVCSAGKRINSAEEARQTAVECLNFLGINDYVVESGSVQLLDSTAYDVVFEKNTNVMPSTYTLTVSVADGCTILIPQK